MREEAMMQARMGTGGRRSLLEGRRAGPQALKAGCDRDR